MKNLKLLLFILLNLSLSSNFYGQDVILKIDLGATKFEYLEYIYFTAILKNESSEFIKISKSEYLTGPDIDIYLFDEKGYKYDNYITGDPAFPPSYYELDPGAEIEFPLNTYYSLQYYMEGIKDLPRSGLDLGKYKLKGILNINRKKIESDWVEFEIIPIKEGKNFDLFKEATIKFFNPLEKEKGVQLYKEIIETSPSSILSLYSIDVLSYWCGGNHNLPIEEVETLKEKALKIFLNYFPDSRAAFYVVTKVIVLFRLGGDEDKTIEYLRELSEKTKNLKMKQKILIEIEKQLPGGLRLIQSEKY